MKFQINTTLTSFTTRELRMFRRLYRSRDLKSTRASNDKSKVSLITYTIFGNMRVLSPSQQMILRNEIEKISNNSKIKFTLFSTPLWKQFTSFSNFESFQTLFKGTTFKRSISIPSNSTIPHEIIIKTLFTQLKKIRFSNNSDNSVDFDFQPIVIFIPTTFGSKVPMRFCYIKNTFDQITSKEAQLREIYSIISSAFRSNLFAITQSSKQIIQYTNIKADNK